MSNPNIILFFTDQQRADFSHEMGYDLDPTPTLDLLGNSGMRFRNAYTPCPICYPARNCLLTGRFAKANGTNTNISGAEMRFEKDLTDILSDGGYHSVLIGKNHTYLQARKNQSNLAVSEAVREAHGFDEEYSARDCIGNLDIKKLHEVDKHYAAAGHFRTAPANFPVEYVETYRLVEKALDWLENDDGQKPFFMQVSTMLPHQPYTIPEPYFSMFPGESIPERLAGPESLSSREYAWRHSHKLLKHYHGDDYDSQWRIYRQVYLGMIRFVDDQIARLINYLEQTGKIDNTIVVVISDHGDYAGEYGLSKKGTGLPQCLIKVPMIWYGAGITPFDAASEAYVSIIDILPTICEIIGAPIPRGVQGRSLWPVLREQDYCPEEFQSIYCEYGAGGLPYSESDKVPLDAFYCSLKSKNPDAPESRDAKDDNLVNCSGRWEAVIKGDWKIIYNSQNKIELYNIKEDPADLTDLSAQHDCGTVLQEMENELRYWMRRSDDILPADIYFPKGAEHNWLRDNAKGIGRFTYEKLVELKMKNQRSGH